MRGDLHTTIKTMKNLNVSLYEWNGMDYDLIPCLYLSSALAIMEENKNVVMEITDNDSTADLTICIPASSPEIISFNL